MASLCNLSHSIQSSYAVSFDDKGKEEVSLIEPQPVASREGICFQRLGPLVSAYQINNLPSDIFFEIFRRVVAFDSPEGERATCTLRRVCRSWCALADNFLIKAYWDRLIGCSSPSMQEMAFQADEKAQELEDSQKLIASSLMERTRSIAQLPYFSRFRCLKKEVIQVRKDLLLRQQEALKACCPYLETDASILGLDLAPYLSVGKQLDQIYKEELWFRIWNRIPIEGAHRFGYIQSYGEPWLNNHIDQVRSVTEIDLSHFFNFLDNHPRIGIRVVLSELERFTELRELDLSWNRRLTAISPAIRNFTGLHRLMVYDTQASSIPGEIGHLTRLSELILNANQLKKVPDSIKELGQLNLLVLSQNQIEHVPDSIGLLTSLKELYLYENRLKTIPETIDGLAKLEILCLQNNQLRKLPPNIGNLPNLTHLNLSHNSLRVAPEAITNLTQLTELDLSGNGMESFPRDIHRLHALKDLDMSCNSLNGVPTRIGQLTQLNRLNLSQGGYFIKTIPDSIGNLIHLIELDLSHNTITVIPDSIGHLESLEFLYLSHNRLDTIPPTIVQLQSLTDLALSANHFSEIPVTICALKNLRKLDLSSNWLSGLPPEIASLIQLEELELSHNHFASIPKEAYELPSLRRLRFFDNPLRNFSDIRKNLANKVKDAIN